MYRKPCALSNAIKMAFIVFVVSHLLAGSDILLMFPFQIPGNTEINIPAYIDKYSV